MRFCSWTQLNLRHAFPVQIFSSSCSAQICIVCRRWIRDWCGWSGEDMAQIVTQQRDLVHVELVVIMQDEIVAWFARALQTSGIFEWKSSQIKTPVCTTHTWIPMWEHKKKSNISGVMIFVSTSVPGGTFPPLPLFVCILKKLRGVLNKASKQLSLISIKRKSKAWFNLTSLAKIYWMSFLTMTQLG